ncbi:MAG: hypothetical protein ACRDAU_04570 [Clostridium sp.]
MKKIDKVIYSLFDKYFSYILMILMLIFSFGITYVFMNNVAGDYTEFLKPWVNYIAGHGGIKSLANIPANYNVPYLYILTFIAKWPSHSLELIKIVSIVFDYILAFGVALVIGEIAKDSVKKRKLQVISFFMILFIPTVILNGAAWAQCDAIYSAFCIYSIYFMIRRKPTVSLIIFGIAFAFKLQTVFLLPVLIILYFSNRKFSILNFLWIPIINIILYLPAWIIGRPFKEIITVYFEQSALYKALALNIPNIYSMFYTGDNSMIRKAGIIFTVVLFATLFYVVIESKKEIDGKGIIMLSLLSVLIATYFLPGMHERYTYLADILSVVYFMIRRDRFYIPIVILFNSFMTYISYLWGYHIIDYQYLAVAQLVVFLIVAKDFYKYLKNNNKVEVV